jgi:hypothetical protein
MEPIPHRGVDSIVSWTVCDFEQGCPHHIAADVLFKTGDRSNGLEQLAGLFRLE